MAAFGDRKLGGMGVRVAQLIQAGLKRKKANVEVRCQHTDYVPRMGGPTPYDITLASALGDEIGRMLRDERHAELPVPKGVPTINEIGSSMARMPISRVRQLLFPANPFYAPEKVHSFECIYRFHEPVR